MWREDNWKIDEICILAIPNQIIKPMHISSLMKTDRYLLMFLSETKIWMCGRKITVKNWWNLPISNPKPDLHNINAKTKFSDNPLLFTEVIFLITVKKWQNLPINNPKSLTQIYMWQKIVTKNENPSEIIELEKETNPYPQVDRRQENKENVKPHHYLVAGYKVHVKAISPSHNTQCRGPAFEFQRSSLCVKNFKRNSCLSYLTQSWYLMQRSSLWVAN